MPGVEVPEVVSAVLAASLAGGQAAASSATLQYAVGRKAVPAAAVDVERVEGVHHTAAVGHRRCAARA